MPTTYTTTSSLLAEAINVEVNMVDEWIGTYYSRESEKDMGRWAGVGYVTESAAAAQWRYAHLQPASGCIRSAPGP